MISILSLISNPFITHKNPLAVLLALIIAAGIFVYGKMQTSLFPEITFPKIKIIADAGLQPVDKMMVSVTKPLEAAIKQVPDLKQFVALLVAVVVKYLHS